MNEINELLALLRQDNYCLMTNEDGVEIYDEHGNLLVCKSESGEWLAVPNSDVIRQFYDLPLESKCGIKRKVGGILGVSIGENNIAEVILQDKGSCEDDTELVWTGQQNQKSRDATTALIELLGSPEYLQLMKDRSRTKLIVWEKIAKELQNKGFKIAKTIKQAGMRTFQKWRNMERTYGKYIKNPDECGEDKRKKKPYYLDAMHSFLIKRDTITSSDLLSQNSFYGDHLFSAGQNEDTEIRLKAETTHTNANVDSLQSVLLPVLQATNEEIAEETVYALVKLMVADTYTEILNGKGSKIRAWEKISDDLAASGFFIPGNSTQEKSQKLFQTWKTIKQSCLEYQEHENTGFDIVKPPYYDLLIKFFAEKMFIDKEMSAEESLVPSECLQTVEHKDHDYDGTKNCVQIFETVTPSLIPSTQCYGIEAEALTTKHTHRLEQNHSSTSISSKKPRFILPKPRVRSSEVLQQIKTQQERAFNAQEQCFSKIISLLEEQVKQQQTLNLLFTQYVTNQSNMNTDKTNRKRHSKTLSSEIFEINNDFS